MKLWISMLNIYAFRIIMNDLDSCDAVLGILYGLFKPVPEYFKDYITFLKKIQWLSIFYTMSLGPYGLVI